ncbi:MAG: hypothetical protein KJ957_07030 [Candidatus Omnitrophica bacterium]|nr:hypothetical protein [Candidatus Omnitrophota bacterium]MBU1853777.1 hypothetical protein [Candidatus Omnitrophota bacterium]
MDKNRFYSVVIPIAMSLICIVLAVNSIVSTTQLQGSATQLNIEKARAVSLDRRVAELAAQLSESNIRYSEEVKRVRELQSSLDTVRKEVVTFKTKLDAALKTQDASVTADISDTVAIE